MRATNAIIDSNKLAIHLAERGLTYSAAGALCMRGSSFINNVIHNGYTSRMGYESLIRGLDVPYDTFLKKDESKTEVAKETGYALTLVVKPDRVRIGLNFDGNEVDYAFAKVLEDSEVGLIKSISYAAHILHKNAEQRDLAID